MNFEKVLDSIKTIKLTGGIFGKTSLVLIVLCICVAAVALKVDVWWVPLALMLPLMALVAYAFKRCLDFAEKNPQAAIMDGAELLIHERIAHAMKGQDSLPSLPPTFDHEPPALRQEDIEAPDAPPPLALPNGGATPAKENK
ncbi:hypothetical protein [Variovorax sp. PBL-E5]|uniref:hypothetical protein n=1 Tax=Variovorax sp. PBL-E5 TaxID=434014 RepID=UPI0013A5A5AE|nr:hypothetical protein [Variovorax sp. PBL-E5]